jgi:VCBS repeat-containing protein
MDLSFEIHTALEQAGLPVITVRDQDGTRQGITITLNSPTPEQVAQAEQIADQVFAS